jgi:deoxyribonuclease V
MPPLHPWTLEPDEAVQLQLSLRERLVLGWDERPVAAVGGVDVGYTGELARAAIVVLSYPGFALLATATAESSPKFPYIPGLLAFREGPLVIGAWEKLPLRPDLLLFDGQGIAHPRGIGLASHLGLWLETPAIGVAKSHLYGRHAPVGPRRRDWSALHDEDNPQRVIGAALRTREKTKPLYVSPGHLIDLEHALAFVLECCRSFRLPEPIRQAHNLSLGSHG